MTLLNYKIMNYSYMMMIMLLNQHCMICCYRNHAIVIIEYYNYDNYCPIRIRDGNLNINCWPIGSERSRRLWFWNPMKEEELKDHKWAGTGRRSVLTRWQRKWTLMLKMKAWVFFVFCFFIELLMTPDPQIINYFLKIILKCMT